MLSIKFLFKLLFLNKKYVLKIYTNYKLNYAINVYAKFILKSSIHMYIALVFSLKTKYAFNINIKNSSIQFVEKNQLNLYFIKVSI